MTNLAGGGPRAVTYRGLLEVCMFAVSERRCKIRDGSGFGSPMLEMGPNIVTEFRTLTASDLHDHFIHVFDEYEDAAAHAGVSTERSPKKKTARKKSGGKKATRKKRSTKAE